MRSRFDEQLALLNRELIEMGALCEEVIALSAQALTEGNAELAVRVVPLDQEIDRKEREIESLCLKLLLQQQPVAKDLRQISAALKMITDMERIGDQAEDIAEIVLFLNGRQSEHDGLLQQMARAAITMVTNSVDAFVKRMNEKAQEIGMRDTHFANPNGLTDPNHYSTPHDMARLAQYAMKNPVFRDFVRQKERRVTWIAPSGKSLLAKNTNELLGRYEGMTGIKTGWTSAAGGCLAASAERQGVHLIAVLMKAPDETTRFSDMRKILDYGFASVTLVKGPTIKEASRHVWVKDGTAARTVVRPATDIEYPLLPGEEASHVKVTYDVPAVISAPVASGQVVGRAILTYDGEEIGRVDMVADDVPEGFSLGSWLVGLFERPLSWL